MCVAAKINPYNLEQTPFPFIPNPKIFPLVSFRCINSLRIVEPFKFIGGKCNLAIPWWLQVNNHIY